MEKEVAFEEWVTCVPKQLKDDPLWQSVYYRLAMYLYDLVWLDTVTLQKDFRGNEIVHQLIRSASSICANMEEAYGRGIGTADYVRIMRISLGEAQSLKAGIFARGTFYPQT